jgi:hypothetical protein
MDENEYMAKWHGEVVDAAARSVATVYGWDGQPIPDRDAWLEVFGGDRRVGRARTTRGEVSTVFMGIDMGFGFLDGSPPILFETMIFGGPLDGHVDRYATLAAARLYHAWYVATLTAGTRYPLIHNGKKSRRAKRIFTRPRLSR